VAADALPPRETRVLRGVLFIVAATLLFVCMNTAVKLLSASLSTVQLLWSRSLGHSLFIIALFAPTFGWRLVVTRKPGIQLTRSVMLLTSSTLFFSAIGRVPLADATAISFTAPFIVALLAGPLLGERVGPGHWLAIGAGFAGALIVIRPAGGGANVYALLVLGSAACYAVYQLLTRRVAGVDPPETSVTYSALIGTVILCALVPFFWRTPTGLLHGIMFAGLGLFGGLGHYFVARGFLWGPASVLSPIHYVQLVWAAVAGYLVFDHVPSRFTWLGAAVIIASGLWIAWRGGQRA
jgi:drug/metabolite transporter (DMT)-like permease